MEKLIEKVDNLKKALDNSNQVKEIVEINKLIDKDKDLLELIKEYNISHDEKIKERIMNNKLFQEYKDKEIELNILVLEINKRLKELTNKGMCVK